MHIHRAYNTVEVYAHAYHTTTEDLGIPTVCRNKYRERDRSASSVLTFDANLGTKSLKKHHKTSSSSEGACGATATATESDLGEPLST